MNLYVNSLFNEYCYKIKSCISYELAPEEYPYYDVDDTYEGTLQYRIEYVDLCVEKSMNIWNEIGFSDDMIVLYEDKYRCHVKNEKEFVESTLKLTNCEEYIFKWDDGEEAYEGMRYIWKTDKINVKKLFKKVILSEIGDNTELDCAVYIIDNRTENVFFIYDDRGIDIFK